MSLTVLLILLIPIFLIPAFMLPKNKTRFYGLGFALSVMVVFAINLINIFLPAFEISDNIGHFFLPMFAFIVNREYLTTAEINHLSFWFFCLLLFTFIYIIYYLIAKKHHIGTNPDVHKIITKLNSVFYVIIFFALTYGVVFIFLIEIREIIPLQDGFLGFIFDWFYKIEA